MAQATARAWKMERASVTKKDKNRSRSNKFSKSDAKARPEPGTRDRVWVGGYERSDGTKVHGHYRGIGGR